MDSSSLVETSAPLSKLQAPCRCGVGAHKQGVVRVQQRLCKAVSCIKCQSRCRQPSQCGLARRCVTCAYGCDIVNEAIKAAFKKRDLAWGIWTRTTALVRVEEQGQRQRQVVTGRPKTRWVRCTCRHCAAGSQRPENRDETEVLIPKDRDREVGMRLSCPQPPAQCAHCWRGGKKEDV